MSNLAIPVLFSHEQIIKEWLRNSPCDRQKRSVVAENQVYVLLHHPNHTLNLGKIDGTCSCHAYVALFRRAEFMPNQDGSVKIHQPIQVWHGQGKTGVRKILGELALKGIYLDRVRS